MKASQVDRHRYAPAINNEYTMTSPVEIGKRRFREIKTLLCCRLRDVPAVRSHQGHRDFVPAIKMRTLKCQRIKDYTPLALAARRFARRRGLARKARSQNERRCSRAARICVRGTITVPSHDCQPTLRQLRLLSSLDRQTVSDVTFCFLRNTLCGVLDFAEIWDLIGIFVSGRCFRKVATRPCLSP